MRIKTKHSPLKTIIIVVVSLLLLAMGVTFYFFFQNKHNDTSTSPPATVKDRPVGETNYDKPTEQQQNAATDEPPANSDTQQSESKAIPVVITYASGSPLQVRVMMSEIISDGTCTLRLQKSDSSIMTQTVDVFPTASSTTCKGFTVDTSKIPKGAYKVIVDVKSNGRTGSASSDITL